MNNLLLKNAPPLFFFIYLNGYHEDDIFRLHIPRYFILHSLQYNCSGYVHQKVVPNVAEKLLTKMYKQ